MLLHEPTFRAALGPTVWAKTRRTAVRELFHFSFWPARTYARGAQPEAALAFNPDLLANAAPVPDAHDYSEAETRTELA